MNKGLLPTGLGDLLPPDAAQEMRLIQSLLEHFRLFSYSLVKPPLAEFEDTLLAHGPGHALSRQTLRLMDPASDRMMALRADITPQIGRIATSRLAGSARPLRLCYTGEILKTRGTQLRPERQYCQTGCELIGALEPAADAEIIAIAAEGLLATGVEDLIVDLCVPTLIPSICAAFGIDAQTVQKLREAVDRRDTTALKLIDTAATPLVLSLLETSGRADTALEKIALLSLPEAATPDLNRLRAVTALLKEKLHNKITLTIDPVEQRGFEYQSGLSFTFLSRRSKAALGRGGRYRTAANEPATGFTFYMPSILQLLPAMPRDKSLFIPAGLPWKDIRELQTQGWVTVPGLTPSDKGETSGCTHQFKNGKITEI